MHTDKTEAPYYTFPQSPELAGAMYDDYSGYDTHMTYTELVEEADRKIRAATTGAEAEHYFRLKLYLQHRAYREQSYVV